MPAPVPQVRPPPVEPSNERVTNGYRRGESAGWGVTVTGAVRGAAPPAMEAIEREWAARGRDARDSLGPLPSRLASTTKTAGGAGARAAPARAGSIAPGLSRYGASASSGAIARHASWLSHFRDEMRRHVDTGGATTAGRDPVLLRSSSDTLRAVLSPRATGIGRGI